MLPNRQVTDFAVTFRRLLRRPVARYLRMRYGLGRRTAGALTVLVFAGLRMLRTLRRWTDRITAPVRLVARGARRLSRLVGRAWNAVRRAGTD